VATVTDRAGSRRVRGPLLAWLGHHLRPGTAQPDYTALTEAALGISLARMIEQHSPGRWLAGDSIGYSRTAGGSEVADGTQATFTALPGLQLDVSAFIPEDYVEDASQRLNLYKRLSGSERLGDLALLYGETLDRFGQPPDPMEIPKTKKGTY
jgi:hypothetical protein